MPKKLKNFLLLTASLAVLMTPQSRAYSQDNTGGFVPAGLTLFEAAPEGGTPLVNDIVEALQSAEDSAEAAAQLMTDLADFQRLVTSTEYDLAFDSLRGVMGDGLESDTLLTASVRVELMQEALLAGMAIFAETAENSSEIAASFAEVAATFAAEEPSILARSLERAVTQSVVAESTAAQEAAVVEAFNAAAVLVGDGLDDFGSFERDSIIETFLEVFTNADNVIDVAALGDAVEDAVASGSVRMPENILSFIGAVEESIQSGDARTTTGPGNVGQAIEGAMAQGLGIGANRLLRTNPDAAQFLAESIQFQMADNPRNRTALVAQIGLSSFQSPDVAAIDDRGGATLRILSAIRIASGELPRESFPEADGNEQLSNDLGPSDQQTPPAEPETFAGLPPADSDAAGGGEGGTGVTGIPSVSSTAVTPNSTSTPTTPVSGGAASPSQGVAGTGSVSPIR